MKSGILRTNMPLGKIYLTLGEICRYLRTTNTFREEGKKWQSRSRRSCRKAVLSPEELRIAGIVRIRGDTQESELFRETVARPFVGFSRLLSPNLDYFDE